MFAGIRWIARDEADLINLAWHLWDMSPSMTPADMLESIGWS